MRFKIITLLCLLTVSALAEGPTYKLGPSFSVLDYKQTGVASTTQVWLSAIGEGEYALSSDWGLYGKAGLGLLPITKSGTYFNLRHLEMSLGASYQGWVVEEEGFFPSAGYHYETFINGDDFGFRNIHGLFGLLNLRLKTLPQQWIGFEMGVTVLNTDSGFSGTNNQLLVGASYSWDKFNEMISSLTLQGQLKYYSLKFGNGEVDANFYSLNILASF